MAYTIGTSGNPRDLNAARLRAQQRLYEDRYRPLEDQLIRQATNAYLPESAANVAAADLRRAFSTADGAWRRRLSRYGMAPTADEARTARRLTLLDAALNTAGAKNQTRQQVIDEQIRLMGDLGQIGRGIRGASSSGLESAARMQNARDQAGKNARSQWRQSLVSSTATGAALGATLLGSTLGTAAGAGIGAGAGFLLALI